MTFPFMPLAAASKVLVSVFDLYMTYRQRANFHPSLPPSPRIRSLIPPSKFHQAQTYCRAKYTFNLVSGVSILINETILTLSLLSAQLWDHAATYSFVSSELSQTLLFLTLLSLISSIIELPFEVYSTFVLEERFGFNKTTGKTFVLDKLKSFALSAAFGFPLVTLFYYILRAVQGFDPFTIAASLWLFSATMMVVMMWLYPNVIAPMFNSFTPMRSDSHIRKKVEQLASHYKFPLSKIYVIDGSTRSSHSNAYIFGLFRKYICIYDTLLNQYKEKPIESSEKTERDTESEAASDAKVPAAHKDSERYSLETPCVDGDEAANDDSVTSDEVVAVVCHELGHWQRGHLGKGVAVALVHSFITFLLYGLTVGNDDLFESFGFSSVNKPVIVSMILFNYVLSPIDDLLTPLHNYISRKHEYEADAFAKKNNMHLQLGNALVRMSIENLSNMNPDHLYSAWNYSHPTLIERLDALGVSPKINLSKKKDK